MLADESKAAFSSTYSEARGKFYEASKRLGVFHISLEIEGEKGPSGEPLLIDISVLGDQTTRPRAVLLHTSGVHGVEGFAGSAIQVDFLNRLERDTKLAGSIKALKGVKIVLVHAVNPYGMAWLRKWNENNVDLNRNFLLGTGDHADMLRPGKRNEMFANFHSTVTPSKGECCHCFLCRLGLHICQFGYGPAKTGLTKGQYEFPDGPFYGGTKLEQGPLKLINALKEIGITPENKELERVVHVDIHTGLGAFGEDTILFDNYDIIEPLRSVYGKEHVIDNRVKDPTLGTVVATEGSCDTMCSQILADSPSSPTILHFAQEFGTLNGVSVLQAIIQETAWWRANKYTDPSVQVKQNILRAFYPKDLGWNKKVLNRGRTVLWQSLRHLSDGRLV